MMEVTLDKDPYLARFADLAKADPKRPGWLATLRQAAIDRYADLGFPTTKLEEWRFTPVSPIASTRFAPAPPSAAAGLDLARLERITFGGPDVLRLVFVNGRLSREMSNLDRLPAGLTVQSLADVLASNPERLEPHLGRVAPYENNAFAALNTALFEDGVFVHTARGAVIERPLHLLFVATPGAEPWAHHPRILVVAEESSRLQMVESWVGLPGVYLTNAVTEVVAGPNAVVDHYKLQRESLSAWHVSTVWMRAERSAVVSNQTLTIGAAINRNDIGAVLGGEGADATLNGLLLIGGTQLVDNHTTIDHAMPHCTSHELYKSVMDGQSRAVFNGRIIVRPDAQKTDSKQTNKNLLLSDKALVNSNPQLEIYADDVKCTHGATIGQLDETALFYLRSRGIGAAAAAHLLTYAFANDVVTRIKVAGLRERLDDYLVHRLREEDGLEETL